MPNYSSKIPTESNPSSYSESEIDLILIEAIGSTVSEEAASDISFEWLLDYSNIDPEDLV